MVNRMEEKRLAKMIHRVEVDMVRGMGRRPIRRGEWDQGA